MNERIDPKEVLETVAAWQIRTQKDGTCSYCGGEIQTIQVGYDDDAYDVEELRQCAECGRITGDDSPGERIEGGV